jgi:hypothetical protein
MSLAIKTTSNNKNLSSNSTAVYVYSDETAELDLSERSMGRFIDVIMPQDGRIKAARVQDLNLGVFVAYNGGVRA